MSTATPAATTAFRFIPATLDATQWSQLEPL